MRREERPGTNVKSSFIYIFVVYLPHLHSPFTGPYSSAIRSAFFIFNLDYSFLFGIDNIVTSGLLCVAAKAFNATHATDERVFVHPAKSDGRSQDKLSYS